ncbi:MAG: hypothetical protein K2J13_04060 [Clostridia bacterium]|nr:hypothetical protein [Clostridia bacterium]
MAKKKSTSKKVEDRSVRSNMNALIGLSACVVIVLAIVIFVVNLILKALDLSGGKVMGVMNLIKDIALGVAVCLSAYYYARGKKKGFRITVFVCIIAYIVLAIVAGVLVL